MSTTNGTVEARRRAIFATVEKKFGFIPNLVRELAESPAVAEAYLSATGALASGVLSGSDQQAVQLTVSAYNDCHYCTAVHGTVGRSLGFTDGDLEAILSGSLPENARLRTIVEATRLVLDKRGWLSPADVQALEESGISRAELYEVIAYVGAKTITNYINH
ncbi:MAG: carboxymuconolactone decarboxylase family protein, partial [Rhodothermales bacterium]